MAEGSCAVSAFFLYVIILGQRRNSGARAAKLPVFFENNFRASVVLFDLSMDLDHPALQLPHVAYALQVTRKDHDGKRAQAKVIAEIQKMNSSRALFDPYYCSGHAFNLAHMFSGFREGETIGPGHAGEENGGDEQRVIC